MSVIEFDLPELSRPYLGMTSDEYEGYKAIIEHCEQLRLANKLANCMVDLVTNNNY